MLDVPAIFGCAVFSESEMKKRLPEQTYRSLKRTIAAGKALDIENAQLVADAMKDWAVEKGATHYTHWFQPLTGITAEKHDSFISPVKGVVIMEFSGRELVRGEPDASSFPSGGLRATFEARGYTAWDPTSYAFIKDKTLCIPTAFCSYGGAALDKKTPLLRSMERIDKQSRRILRLFGQTDVARVAPTVGPEQEYFLIDKQYYKKRPDLMYCGRTLFGARPSKGQELDDHYFGAIKLRVAAFMEEVDIELWKLGVLAKTEHNEAAPGQHELAPIFTTGNLATDHNQLTMETMKKVADRHGLVCLLHEKPFAGVNGSGKHNNWSLCTDRGENLLDPGETPSQNARFLLFLAALIKSVDEHQDLLRASVASAGNDHRLGANEAPPAIISMFLGDELTKLVDDIESGELHEDRPMDLMEIGSRVLPAIPKDNTDRNRTSPFAFTGNKFEFRMPGASSSVADPNMVLNTIVADTLSGFADALEVANDFKSALESLVRDTIRAHKRIIFNGDGYTKEWEQEAERRGLLHLRSTVGTIDCWTKPENVELFERQRVLSREELASRGEIIAENYCKTLHIEGLTMLDMAQKAVVPAVLRYEGELARVVTAKKAASAVLDCAPEQSLLERISALTASLTQKIEQLQQKLIEAKTLANSAAAHFYRDEVFTSMMDMRCVLDELESIVAQDCWPYPTYGDLLYSAS